jgi:hypothetical protein
MTKYWKKFTAEKKVNIFFKSKIAIYLSLGQATGETLRPLKRTASTSKHEILFVSHFCPSGSRSGSTDLIESGSGTLVSNL